MTFIITYDRNNEEECIKNMEFVKELGVGTRVMARPAFQRWGGPAQFKRDAQKGTISRLTVRRPPKEDCTSYTRTMAVEADRYIKGHNCGGLCKEGYGYWISPFNLNVIMDACGSYKGIVDREKQRAKDNKKYEERKAKYGY